MATFIISYDLNSPGQDYSSLFEAIESVSTNSWHCLDSTWLIVSPKSAKEIRDILKHEIDENDAIFVIKSGGIGAWTGFSRDCSSWLKDNL